jgi:hypothetical protein
MDRFELSRRHMLVSGAALAAAGAAHAKSKTAQNASAADLDALAEEAAIWGLPLVQTGRYLELAKSKGALNQFYISPALATPSLKVPGPNVDTTYGYAWLDLAKEPLVLDVPDANDRYYSIQFTDAYENTFAYVGRRETGTKAGTYVLAGLNWKGAAPAGAKVIHAPSTIVFVLTRTLVRSAADAATALDLQARFTLAPLSNYPAGKKGGVTVEDSIKVIPAFDLSGIGATYFDELDALVRAYPPTGPEAETFARYAALDIGTNAKRRLPASQLQAAYERGYKRVHTVGIFSKSVNGWQTNYNIEKFIKDPVRRAAVNQYGPGAHIAEEALYFSALTDHDGARLNGANHYEITFPAGQLPPVNGFWSLTLYDKDFWLVANPIDRYAIHDRTPGLKPAADGSLRILLQRDKPADAANWLPAPDGDFRLILRTYQPKQELLSQKYAIPAVQKVSA